MRQTRCQLVTSSSNLVPTACFSHCAGFLKPLKLKPVSSNTVDLRQEPIFASAQERRNVDRRDSNGMMRQLADAETETEEAETLISILTERCNNPEILKSSLAGSQEGQFEDIGKYELALVQVVTRHGDRTPFGDIPLVNFTSFRCPNGYQYFLNNATWNKCLSTQLTSTGCKQHQLLGKHFQTVYQFEPKQLAPRMLLLSSSYQRTIYSARCLAFGLLNNFRYEKIFLSHDQDLLFRETILQASKSILACPGLKVFENELRSQPNFVRLKHKWQHVKVEANSHLSSLKNVSNLTFGVLEFYEGLVCHFCHYYSPNQLESITPRFSNQRFPLGVAKEIVQAADQKTEHTCDEKV